MSNNNEKRSLIREILSNPHSFNKEKEVQAAELLDFQDVRELIRRIYDVNEKVLLEISDANAGNLAWPNRKATKRRQKKYYKRISNGHRIDNRKNSNQLILAEGDSWFQFPLLIKEIIDWLIRDKRNAVFSIAYAGDWVTNIIYDGEYISELAIHKPDVFLISGGGNDLLGASKLAVMLKLPSSLTINPEDYIKDEFYSFILTLKIMYRKMFGNIQKSGKYNEMKIITQGYDYPFPRMPKFKLKHPLNAIITKFYGSGKWICLPMDIVGIPDERLGKEFKDLRRDIMRLMINAFNTMFISLAGEFDNVFHIDCRGVAPRVDDWYDEIHLRSKSYQVISAAYNKLIHTDLEQLQASNRIGYNVKDKVWL